jgi:RHS repeat-associated protein
MHPEANRDLSFAIELKGKAFFPLQDFRGNICALQMQEGGPERNVVQWIRYSAFGSKTIAGQLPDGLSNPWRFANRREVGDLSLFTHRFYNPQLMRWQTTDPLGFEVGLNLYAYVRNNPFYYRDLDGCNPVAIEITITIVEIVIGAVVEWFPCIVGAIETAIVAYGVNQLADYVNEPDPIDNPEDDEEEQLAQDNRKKKPRYCGSELGNDPTRRPGEGFEWRGRGGPETGKGSWVKDHKQPTEQSLHPDLTHPPPKAPHWDYVGPDAPKGAELYLDGTWVIK